MFSNKKVLVLFVILLAGLVLAACAPAEDTEPEVVTVVVEGPEGETVVVTATPSADTGEEVEETEEPEVVDRNGGWLDTVIFVEEPNSDAAVTRLETGDIDVYAYNISEPDIAQRIYESEAVGYEVSYGNYNDLTFMPSTGPEFTDGRLNPFYSDKIREAMNWLIDRDYIAQEISGGLGRPRFVPMNFASKDMALLADTVAGINLRYAHNPDKAVEVINAEMEALGAELVDGKWNYNGEPVVLIGLIRVEDERLEIGDYVSNLLEDIGFTVQRDYKTSSEASPCWLRGDPDEGCAHFYTGGWVSTAISRDEATNFSFFYTPDGLPFPPWQAYSPSDEFYEVATKLNNSDFTTMAERADLMSQALDLALLDSQRIWLKDDTGVAPHAANVALASDLSGSIYGSNLWAETMRFTDREPGGSMTIAMPSIMTEPWNQIAGSNWVYDAMPYRGMQNWAVVADPFTGLALPFRLEKAEVFVEEGLPVDVTYDWVTLEFVPEITVPDDAWADWDAENQVFITAAERAAADETFTLTSKSKVVMYYEEDYFDKVKWHDGSPVTIADHIFFAIMQFDPSKEASPIYDEATVSAFETFMAAFKGWKIVSEDPFVVEYYTDAYGLDAENNVSNFRAMHGAANQMGEAPWHTLVLGWAAEANGELAFSADKAESLEVEWMSYIAGPSLEILKAKLDEVQAANLIPYEPTLGQYITADEATARYANAQEWFRRYGHFWVASGPYFLQRAFPVEGTLILQYNPEFPDKADRWSQFAAPPVPTVVVDGPDRVDIGSEAVYDVYVDVNMEPFSNDDTLVAAYLVFDATGAVVAKGEPEFVEDGYYTVTLGTDLTGSLTAGSNQLAVIFASKRALVPVQDVLQFVTQ